MITDGANYKIRHGKKQDTCMVYVWDPILKKQYYQLTKIPAELKGNAVTAFCLEQVKKFQQTVSCRSSTTSPKTSFREFFYGEWSEYKLSEGKDLTLSDYHKYFKNHLEDKLGPVPLNKITPRLLSNIYGELYEEGLSLDFVNRIHRLIGQVLADAKLRGILEKNVARENMKPPKRPSKTADVDRNDLTEEQCRKIINAVNDLPLYWKTLYGVTIATGMRREEIAALRWETVFSDPDRLKILSAVRIVYGKELRIKEPKSATSKRGYAFTGFLKSLLKQWNIACNGKTTGYVFFSTTDDEKPVHPDSITKKTYHLSKKLGFHFTFHDLRHNFISKSITVIGADPRTVQSLSGHSDVRVTMGIYAHSNMQQRKEVQEKFENHFNLNELVGPMELNDADEEFSLVSYVERQKLSQNEISSLTNFLLNSSEKSEEPQKSD